MQKDYTHIEIILDRSGSMASIANDIIGGYNTFLTKNKAHEGKATLSLLQFDHAFDEIYEFKPIKSVPKLTEETFVPRGTTALYDAIGRTIIKCGSKLANMPEDKRPDRVLIAIFTDGLNNSSKEFTASKIKEMIEHQTTTYNWYFVFVGSNQDAILAAADIGIPMRDAMTMANNSKGTRRAFEAFAANTVSFRGLTDMQAINDYKAKGFYRDDDKARQKEAGATQSTSV